MGGDAADVGQLRWCDEPDIGGAAALAATLASRVLRRWWRPAACSRPGCAPYAAGRGGPTPHPRVGPVASRYRISRPERSGGREQLAPGHGPREQGGGRPGAVLF